MAYITFQPSDHFNTLTYSGTGGNGTTTTQAITGAGFQPDWVWLKQRTGTQNHQLCDVIRGANNVILSNSSNAQAADTQIINSFDSDGFTAGYQDQANDIGHTYVSWLWKGGGSGSANTDGSTSSTVSANTTAGFSIVKYTNPSSGSPFTVGHGLGAVPKMIMVKNLSASQAWGVYHTGPGFGKYLQLNSTSDEAAANLVTATSTTTFSTYQDHHSTGNELIAYCFAEKKGFSKIGIYRGNGNANGPMVYTGFKPAFVLFKEYTGPGSSNWTIQDNKRVGYNPNNNRIYPNDSAAENTSSFRIDILSNGFKLRSSDTDSNRNGNDFLYLAFAEHPLVSSNDVPATAR